MSQLVVFLHRQVLPGTYCNTYGWLVSWLEFSQLSFKSCLFNMFFTTSPRFVGLSLLLLAVLPTNIAGQILKTSGVFSCLDNSAVKVDHVQIEYDNDKKTIVFDLAGTSLKSQNVSATLDVVAYGKSVYTKSFNPCDASTFVQQLCPGMVALTFDRLPTDLNIQYLKGHSLLEANKQSRKSSRIRFHQWHSLSQTSLRRQQ